MIERYQRCSSFQFYIKPQPLYECVPSCFVVPHSNSTSNHNVEETTLRSPQLFLIPILHQTTTDNRVLSLHSGCSSFQFYIKPQLSPAIPRKAFCCSSFQFYIKPQRSPALPEFPPGCSSFQFYIKPQHGRPLMEVDGVVPHSNSTSNHNTAPHMAPRPMLFLIPILHQTTTIASWATIASWLFLIPILHQTTTSENNMKTFKSCSSFQFYIKPQPAAGVPSASSVVPHSNSTSNHNVRAMYQKPLYVVPHSNSTSNHNVYCIIACPLNVVPHSNSTSNHNTTSQTVKMEGCSSFQFYIKPQRDCQNQNKNLRCSSFQFYIKPQPRAWQ